MLYHPRKEVERGGGQMVNLYEHQKQILAQIKNKKRVLMAVEMGLG